jgi:hypothetical protein
MEKPSRNEPSFVVCVSNQGFPAALEVRKIYEAVADPVATARHYLRIVDESGEDYLYPESLFAPIDLPESLRDALRLAG